MTTAPRHDLFRTVLLVAIFVGLGGLTLWVLRPFLPALIWATTIAVATWPLMAALQRRLWNRRALAVTVMTVALLLVLVLPLLATITTVVRNSDQIGGWLESLQTGAYDVPPSWLAGLPLVGERLDAKWRELAASGDLGQRVAPYLAQAARWLIAQMGTVGAAVVQILLAIVMTAVIYMNGETAAAGMLAFARRVGGERAAGAIVLAGQSIRGVALGVVVTALAQSLLGGIGLAIAGVPLVPLLTAVMFLCAVAQIGAVPVMACAVVWLYAHDSSGWGTALLVWTVLVGLMDNVMRPILIKRGVDLPLLLIFSGVVGGLMAFGVVGIFIGPIVLAVTWTLFAAWVRADPAPPEPLPPL
jgi:predicted PurR-regulated permease PerM